jgi:hypothetical protein
MNALIFSAFFSTASLCLGCELPNDVQLLSEVQVSGTATPDQNPEPSPSPLITAPDTALNQNYAYVLAPGGLFLRAHNNLHSKRLTLMPWGSKVLIKEKPLDNTMTVSGIPGTMYTVRFNDLEGYAFSGYLGPYAPPGHKMNAAQYAAYLREIQEVDTEPSCGADSKILNLPQYSRMVSEDLTAPSVTETLLMPGMNLNQAYLVAQRLFGIPEDLKCPSVAGPENAVYPDKKPKKGIWKSELAVRRANGQIEEMTYLYRSKNFMRRVHLAPRENGVLIKAHEANIL